MPEKLLKKVTSAREKAKTARRIVLKIVSAQTMYAHVSKCKNDEIKRRKEKIKCF